MMEDSEMNDHVLGNESNKNAVKAVTNDMSEIHTFQKHGDFENGSCQGNQRNSIMEVIKTSIDTRCVEGTLSCKELTDTINKPNQELKLSTDTDPENQEKQPLQSLSGYKENEMISREEVKVIIPEESTECYGLNHHDVKNEGHSCHDVKNEGHNSHDINNEGHNSSQVMTEKESNAEFKSINYETIDICPTPKIKTLKQKTINCTKNNEQTLKTKTVNLEMVVSGINSHKVSYDV